MANNPCPVCGLQLVKVYEDYMDTVLMESQYKCETGHYIDTFEHGVTVLVIAGEEVHSGWNDTLAQQKQFDETVSALIEKAKQDNAQ